MGCSRQEYWSGLPLPPPSPALEHNYFQHFKDKETCAFVSGESDDLGMSLKGVNMSQLYLTHHNTLSYYVNLFFCKSSHSLKLMLNLFLS